MRFTPYALTIIASNNERFVDFAPYVASINDQGMVAFQATLPDGHSGVFSSDGESATDIAVSTAANSPVARFASHPDINQAGSVCVYGELQGGVGALLFYDKGRLTVAGTQAPFTGIGPLGPTMNEQGDVAFRATLQGDQAAICLQQGDASLSVAVAGQDYRAFEGLPVVNNTGRVAFRADLPDGRQGVFLQQAGECVALALTGEDFTEIARFPIVNDQGMVAFAATRTSGMPGIFAVTAAGTINLVEAATGFESFRGVLINNRGLAAFYGTPVGGKLGIYIGPDATEHRLLGLGDTLYGAEVVDLALNPVSVNEAGQLAIRVALKDGRQFILRADPAV